MRFDPHQPLHGGTEVPEVAEGVKPDLVGPEQYRASLEGARSRDEACAAVVDLICGSYATTDEVRALFEMYSFGNYDAKVHDLCRDWLLVSRASLGLHFTQPTARALDALVEAFPMHQAWEGEPLDRAYVAAVVQALVDRFEPARDVA